MSGTTRPNRLVGGGNQGGFRYLGSLRPFQIHDCVLYSDLGDPDWPDRLEFETRVFTCYGDNKTPGNDLPGRKRGGNAILQQIVADYRDHPPGPYGFERCAAELFRLMQPNVLSLDLTRPAGRRQERPWSL